MQNVFSAATWLCCHWISGHTLSTAWLDARAAPPELDDRHPADPWNVTLD
jgi:hypothetical protein